MDRTLLHEHDANQGAQSRGEFLGMTGNSGWYLLGSIGASLLMVILCWGMLGVSLLVCLLAGFVLCGLSVAYVFVLKNNRPEHFDTDFFECALIEAGMMEMAFGPRQRRIANPFTSERTTEHRAAQPAARERTAAAPKRAPEVRPPQRGPVEPATPSTADLKRNRREVFEPVVPLAAYEHVRDDLDLAEEMLEDVLAERAEG